MFAVYRDPMIPENGLERSAYVVQYENGLTSGLKAPTYAAYIPTPPTEAQYLDRRVAHDVGHSLGFTYPDTLDQRVVSYLMKVKQIT